MEKTGTFFPVACTYVRSGIYADMTAQEINKALKLSGTKVYIKKTDDPDFNRYALMKFDISECNPEQKKINVLFLGKTGSPNNEIAVYRIPNDWTSETVTWNTCPKGELYCHNAENYFDMTQAVMDAQKKGEKYVSFRFENENITEGETQMLNSTVTCPECETKLSEDPEENKAIWAHAEKIVDEWFSGLKDKIYAGGQTDVHELPKTDVSIPSGAHTIPVDGSGTGNPPTPNFRTLYARTIDTLAEKCGYEEGRVPLSEYDEYGGIRNAGFTGEATGFFHTEKHGKRTYIIDPIGNPFFSVGVNTMNSGCTKGLKEVAMKKFGTEENFWNEMTKLLTENGINTQTGGSGIAMRTPTPMVGIAGLAGIGSYMREMGLSTSTGGSSAFANNNTMNVFDPEFPEFVERKNRPICENNAGNPYILGYTSDNELPKEPKMLENYLTLDPSNPVNYYSYAVAWTWLRRKSGVEKPTLFDAMPEYREEFKALVFGMLFKTVADVKEKYDRNHMYIGTRADAMNKTSEGYLRAAGTYCDVLTINMYDGMEPSVATMATIYRYSGRPFIVTEFYAKAQDAYDLNGQLLANQQNAGWLVKTQKDRGAFYENYTMLLLESRYCVGWIWYKFQDNDQSLYSNGDGKSILRCYKKGARYTVETFIDQDGNIVPATGNEVKTWEGEIDTSNLGSNKGIVDVHFEPYAPVFSSFARISKNLIGLTEFFDQK